MNKKIRLIGKFMLPIITIGLVVPAISMQATSSNPKSGLNSIVFANKTFTKNDDVIKFMIDNGDLLVNDEKVLGDISASYLNSDTGELRKNTLPDYDEQKINIAYLMASGVPTKSLNAAINSYFNPAMIVKKFTDSFGNLFDEMDEAKRSINSSLIEPYLGFYNNVPVFDSSGNIKSSERINPLNSVDVANYSRNILDNVNNILINTITGNIKGGYTMELDESKLTADQKTNLSRPSSINFANNIRNKFHSSLQTNNNLNLLDQDTTALSATNHGFSIKTAPETFELKWKSNAPEYLNSSSSKDAKRSFSVNWGIHKNSDLNDPLLIGYGKAQTGGYDDQLAQHYDGSSLLWMEPNDGGEFAPAFHGKLISSESHTPFDESYWGDLISSDILKIMNFEGTGSNIIGDGLGSLISVAGNTKTTQTNLDNLFSTSDSEVENALNAVKQVALDDYVANNIPPLFRGSALSAIFKNGVQSLHLLDAHQDLTSQRYMPTLNLWSDNLVTSYHSGGPLNLHNKISLDSVKPSAFSLRKKSNFLWNSSTANEIFTITNDTTKKLVNSMWTLDASSTLPIIIKKDGHTMFSADLQYNSSTKSPSVKLGTWKNISTKDLENDSIAKHIFRTFNIDGLRDSDQQKSIETILSAINNDLLDDQNKPLHDLDLDKQYTFSETIKQFLFWFKKVYESSNSTIKPFVKDSIPRTSQDILFFGSKITMSAGYYRYLGPSYLNPKLGDQSILAGDLLATTSALKTALSNMQIVSSPSMVNVAYDTNGNVINSGKYFFDSEEVIRQNILNSYSPRRDQEHIYVEDQLVKNTINIIKHVVLYGHNYYFDKYDSFYRFINEYIDEHGKK